MDYNRGRNWKENAVLYRMNAQSNALEYAFKRNGVPYQVDVSKRQGGKGYQENSGKGGTP